jgi:Arc/MetJ-type ribon-helix-helix transcriptional regulator
VGGIGMSKGLSVRLTEEMEEKIKDKIAEGSFRDTSDYIRNLLEKGIMLNDGEKQVMTLALEQIEKYIKDAKDKLETVKNANQIEVMFIDRLEKDYTSLMKKIAN